MSIQSSREFAALGQVIRYGTGRVQNARRPLQPVFSFGPGELIFEQGEQAGKLFTVESGIVRLCHLLADGRRQISAFHMPGEVFGFTPFGVHEFFAEAIENTSVSVCRMGDVAATEYVEAALSGLFSAQKHLLVLGRQLAGERLASFLIDMDERQGKRHNVHLAMTRCDIADYLGLTVETVSRTLTKLVNDGLIRLHGARNIEILKPEALLEITC